MRTDGQSYVFRALVLATLLWVATGFAMAQREDPGREQNEAAAAPKAPEVGPPETFGAKLLSDPTAFFTMALAALTAVLAATAAGQIYYLRRTDETARRTAEAAFKAAEAAERSAVVAENALIGADAPFVFPVIEGWRRSSLGSGDGLTGFGFYALHNYGRSAALVREVEVVPVVLSRLPGPFGLLPFRGSPTVHALEIIPTGQSSVRRRVEGGQTSGWGTPDDARDEAHWVVGQIRYTDTLGTQYLSGFCMAYNPSTNIFHAQGGSGHNYRRRLSEDETRQAEARDAELPSYLKPPPEHS